MKPSFLLIVVSLLLTMGTKAQKTDQKQNLPQEKSTVKKEFDDKGNLIRFDSTYTYTWSGDTALNKTFLPDQIQEFLGTHLSDKGDSSFFNNPTIKDFDQFFSHSSVSKQDSILLRKFGMSPHFQGFSIVPDSLALNFRNFDGFFEPFFRNRADSIGSKSGKAPGFSSSKSMEDLMKKLEQRFQEIEKQQQEFFSKPKNLKEL